MSSAADIAALPHFGPKGRTIVVVPLILSIVPWSPSAGSLGALGRQEPLLKPPHATPFLTVMQGLSASPRVRALLTFRQIWHLTPALCGLTLPAHVQADL